MIRQQCHDNPLTADNSPDHCNTYAATSTPHHYHSLSTISEYIPLVNESPRGGGGGGEEQEGDKVTRGKTAPLSGENLRKHWKALNVKYEPLVMVQPW